MINSGKGSVGIRILCRQTKRDRSNHSHSMVEVADSCSNSIMSYHLVIGRPTSNEYSQYRFELSRFAISGLGMRE